ncbi:response regulator transcription factor [Sediminitomix flava]|uniref:Phosphate regulon transcriptional regulatory protein PhoB n=1 Tax=Sediminitomix flava TaxID=379075 RepID=A0A315Z5Y8_SEDFL|nr:response regulator transcription factor [Sediminitomix flava]PWJ39318.1 two-component system alkaline phosphatase synthesis response regulator PhoP [Sediminitomix flava]
MDNKKYKVLVVDDEPDIVEILTYNLNAEGYDVYSASNGKKGVDKAKEIQPDLVLMDIMMPVMDGVEACRRIKEIPQTSKAYIIFLTARAEEYSEIAAFDVGGDDYIVKPVKPRALMKRIKTVLERKQETTGEEDRDVLSRGKFTIDRTSYTLFVEGEPMTLPKKEFELLYFLARNPKKVFSRDELLKNIWGSDVYVLARTVDVHIRRVREKIGNEFIKTVKGVGYKFEVHEN